MRKLSKWHAIRIFYKEPSSFISFISFNSFKEGCPSVRADLQGALHLRTFITINMLHLIPKKLKT